MLCKMLVTGRQLRQKRTLLRFKELNPKNWISEIAFECRDA